MPNSVKSREIIEAIIQEAKLMTTGQVITFFRSRKQLDFLESILDFFPHGDKIAIEHMLNKEIYSTKVHIMTLSHQKYISKNAKRGDK